MIPNSIPFLHSPEPFLYLAVSGHGLLAAGVGEAQHAGDGHVAVARVGREDALPVLVESPKGQTKLNSSKDFRLGSISFSDSLLLTPPGHQ